MSYTAIYTPLHPLDVPASDIQREPGAVTQGVRIRDPAGLREYLPDWGTEMHTQETTYREEYPNRTWEVLEGFKTWEFDEFNIERLAIPSDDAVAFWKGIEQFTEPFQFFSAYFDGGYPHALDIVTAGRPTEIAYHVVCFDGHVWVNEVAAERAGDPERVYTGSPDAGLK